MVEKPLDLSGHRVVEHREGLERVQDNAGILVAKRAEQLARDLDTTSRTNNALGARLLEITGKLEESLEELQDAQFTDKVQQLMVQIDSLGDSGLRESLSNHTALTQKQSAALLALLVDLDATLRTELEAKRVRCADIAASSRACISNTLRRAAETTV